MLRKFTASTVSRIARIYPVIWTPEYQGANWKMINGTKSTMGIKLKKDSNDFHKT
jgi:hypothetical protein